MEPYRSRSLAAKYVGQSTMKMNEENPYDGECVCVCALNMK